MFYTSEPEALRAFFRDVLGFPATDVGGGWLIFDLPEAEMGCHPTGHEEGEASDVPSGTPHISFYCDDLAATMDGLRSRGVEFVDEPEEVGYGIRTAFRAPGNFTIELYQPSYRRG
jgi:catechol 2,3-dioxygenase-like lactoylglutathione lyase family enzyme